MSKNILRNPKTTACVLALITLALFWPATRYGFIELDDDNYVSGNPYVQQGFTPQSVAWATTATHEGYWLPITWISFILDRAIQGPEPAGYHRTNVLLHAANVVLLFLVGFRLTGNLWGSALLAGLFGWHPLRVEAAVWISSRKDVLSTFFGLLAILAYVRYVRLRERQARWGTFGNYLLVFMAMAAGLMAKPMLVTLPFALLLLDFWPLERWSPAFRLSGQAKACTPTRRFMGRGHLQSDDVSWDHEPPACCAGFSLFCGVGRAKARTTNERFMESLGDLLLEKAPLLLLSMVFILVTLSTHRSSGSMHRPDAIPLVDHLIQIPANYCHYLGKIFWPADLAVRYPPLSTPRRESILMALLLVAWTAFCVWGSRHRPWALVGWFWFLGTFIPIIGLVRIGTADFADRFTYVPSMGISLLATGAILSMLPGRLARTRIVVAVILLAAGGLATRQQLRFWADGEILFRRALQVTRNNAAAHNALGRTLEKQGRWQEAVSEYRASLGIAPAFGQAHANLGNVLGMLGRYDEAGIHFQAALKGTPDDAKVHSNYGAILSEAGQKAEGVRHLREAVRLNPHLADAHFNLGAALLEAGQPEEALEHFVNAARINPGDDAAQFEAGRLYLARGNREMARACFAAALSRRPDNQDYVQALQKASGPESIK